MNKAQLIKNIAETTKLKPAKAKEALEATLTTIGDALASGDKVKIVGFGTFESKPTKERMGVNPQNPTEKIVIPARNKVSFKPSSNLKEIING
ncbi:HU family DNA-binding protein [Peptoniphilus sp. AGMB00490]|uniref:HU family DNA-binding protein n=1 Tax=Peptoniphilus faecalis TaxID=2731255 RepID=A0A848RK63_9FIRM|nr:HU family DNA-binding protein [Peptoniphilus faecalis]NMW84722.1 HU family DNA-binding protein [Peptoniphilus faecalis]